MRSKLDSYILDTYYKLFKILQALFLHVIFTEKDRYSIDHIENKNLRSRNVVSFGKKCLSRVSVDAKWTQLDIFSRSI